MKKNTASKETLEFLRQKIIEHVAKNPKKAAKILSLWLHPQKKSNPVKKAA
jgi:hypothetical protein